jgi:mRNA interferase RelE/StbE
VSTAYKIELSPAAEKQLRKLSEPLKSIIIKKLDTLKLNPNPPGVQKLSAVDDLYRIRIGDYRVIYQVEHQVLLILVLKIGNRKDIYTNLKALTKNLPNK